MSTTGEEKVDFLAQAEEAFSAKFAEATGGVMAGHAQNMRPVTLVVLCAPKVIASTTTQEVSCTAREENEERGERNTGDEDNQRSENVNRFAFGDTLNAYLERRIQIVAGLHLNLSDEVADAGKLLQRWVIEGPSIEVSEEANQEVRQPDGTTVSCKRIVKRNTPSSLPFALLSLGGLPDTVIVQAYFTGTQGGFVHPTSAEAATTATEKGAEEADRWIRHVTNEISVATGQPPVTVIYRPGFEEQFSSPSSSTTAISQRLKQKALAEIRGQKAGSVTEFCFDEVNQLPWLRPVTYVKEGTSDEDQQEGSSFLQFLQSLPSLKGMVKAGEPLVDYIPGSNGRSSRLPGKAIRQAQRMKESAATADAGSKEEDVADQSEETVAAKDEEGADNGADPVDASPQEEQARAGQDDDEEMVEDEVEGNINEENQNTSEATGAGAGVDDSSFSIQSRAKVAALTPIGVNVEEGQTYYWCTCGHSKNQPWCDGSHVAVNEKEGSEFKPIAWTAETTEEKYFCQCKQTKTAPFCDGSHTSAKAEEEGTEVKEEVKEEEPKKVEDEEEAVFEH